MQKHIILMLYISQLSSKQCPSLGQENIIIWEAGTDSWDVTKNIDVCESLEKLLARVYSKQRMNKKYITVLFWIKYIGGEQQRNLTTL